MVMPGKRIPTRGKRTGSVRIVAPKKLMRTVECPSHASVSRVSLHFDGSGLAKAGAIRRQLSTVHSLKRCPSHRRTLDPRGAGCCGACTSERNTAIMAQGQRTGSLHDESGRMPDWRPYGLPNNPLSAFHSVRAGLGGPARATRTGTFDRFKISRVKSPMM
jgi:hypothetical protein